MMICSRLGDWDGNWGMEVDRIGKELNGGREILCVDSMSCVLLIWVMSSIRRMGETLTPCVLGGIVIGFGSYFWGGD